MEKSVLKMVTAIIVAMIATSANFAYAQESTDNYKHPYINSSGRVLDENGIELGWITKDRIVHNAKGEKVAFIKENEVTDSKGKKIGKMDKNGTYYDANGAAVFTIDTESKGEQCKLLDPQGKVIATVHEGYKNQACAIHCLYKKVPMK